MYQTSECKHNPPKLRFGARTHSGDADDQSGRWSMVPGRAPAGVRRLSAPQKCETCSNSQINPKTVAKWRRCSSVCDARMGPREPRSTILSKQEEALVVAFRRHTLLPLDVCLYALQATVAHLTRSSLHRCFRRHGISRLPETQSDKTPNQKFKPIQSASFTSILPRCEPRKASSTCSSQSIGASAVGARTRPRYLKAEPEMRVIVFSYLAGVAISCS